MYVCECKQDRNAESNCSNVFTPSEAQDNFYELKKYSINYTHEIPENMLEMNAAWEAANTKAFNENAARKQLGNFYSISP